MASACSEAGSRPPSGATQIFRVGPKQPGTWVTRQTGHMGNTRELPYRLRRRRPNAGSTMGSSQPKWRIPRSVTCLRSSSPIGTQPKWTRHRPSSQGSSPTRSPARQLLTYHCGCRTRSPCSDRRCGSRSAAGNRARVAHADRCGAMGDRVRLALPDRVPRAVAPGCTPTGTDRTHAAGRRSLNAAAWRSRLSRCDASVRAARSARGDRA